MKCHVLSQNDNKAIGDQGILIINRSDIFYSY